MSQATCKVCQNKILIRRPPEGTPADELISAPGISPRQPQATPTRISGEEDEPTIADPEPPPIPRAGLSGEPSTLSAPLPGEGSGLTQLPETELSNSWREAILDNRPTVAMLKKMGLPGPAENSTASGPAVVVPPVGAVPPPPSPAPWAAAAPVPFVPPPEIMEPTVFSDLPPAASSAAKPAPPWAPPAAATAAAPTAEQMEPTVFTDEPPPGTPKLANGPAAPAVPGRGEATGRTAGTITNVQQMPTGTTPKPSVRVATPPRPFVKEGSSQLLSLASGVGGSGIVAAMVWNGSWGAGLSGWLAFGVACFIAAGGLLNSLLRGPGFFAVFGVGFLAAIVAIAGMLAVFLTGGPRTRVLAEAHTFLAPLAAYERSLSKGAPDVTPEPDASATPDAAASPEPSVSSSAAESPAPSATP